MSRHAAESAIVFYSRIQFAERPKMDSRVCLDLGRMARYSRRDCTIRQDRAFVYCHSRFSYTPPCGIHAHKTEYLRITKIMFLIADEEPWYCHQYINEIARNDRSAMTPQRSGIIFSSRRM